MRALCISKNYKNNKQMFINFSHHMRNSNKSVGDRLSFPINFMWDVPKIMPPDYFRISNSRYWIHNNTIGQNTFFDIVNITGYAFSRHSSFPELITVQDRL